MYPVNQLQNQAIAVLCAVIVFIFYSRRKLFNSTHIHKPGKTAPEPAGAWPIIGHLHLLGGAKLMYRTLGSLADEYGPVFMVRLGMRRVLVISNTESARECFTTNDKVFATRPTTVATDLLTYNHSMFGFATYGPYWREIRKIATMELLSDRRLAILKNVWISEINVCINELHQLWIDKNSRKVDHHQHVYNPISVEMNGWFADFSFNVVARMIAGKRYFGKKSDGGEEETRRYREAMNDFMHLLVIFLVSDAVPFLGGLDFQGYKKRMKKTAKEIDYFLGKWVDEHRQRLKYKNVSKVGQQDDDFIDVLLLNLNDQPIYGRDTDTIIKSTCLSLIAGGSDTTAVTLTWALSLLLNNRHVLRKTQDELDIHVGRERQVEESDIKNLVYLQAIVKETLRLYPAAPLSAPRMAMEDCTVAGFQVTKGTQLMLNLWKLHRDPHFWGPDPLEFRPERFLTANSSSTGSGCSVDIDVKGRHYELLPFGSGRRMCPGVSFAMQVIHLTIATLLHGFHLSTPTDGPVDMTETSGLSCPKATPLVVLLTPRLPSYIFCDLADRCDSKVEHLYSK
ncbi:cytochrome P450 CYP82D47-like [Papaver somniferum]|uniref:cytochrome P450 CYP82D47-like n=1 Tax=Papaver somniferum TaxID=3469 RepID=UPI000E6FD6C3|nr:cytochrome P450 CYP82D47-like [Papaver somniferum]